MKVATDLSYRGAIRFRVDHLTVYQGWALLHGQPVTPAGVPIRKKCLEADDITAVLLHQRDGVWRVERGGTTCATDVFWLGWQEELDAPRQLFQISD